MVLPEPMANGPQVVVCVPAFNEEKTIAKIVLGAKLRSDHVIVCDDGSTDMTGAIARAIGVQVLSHETNRGKGVALETLMQTARALNPAVVVTIDGDDQHDPAD